MYNGNPLKLKSIKKLSDMNSDYKYYKHRAIFWFLRIGYKSESSKIEVAQLIQKDTFV